MPTSTPLRAIAVRTGEPGTSAAQSSASLEKTIARLRKNWPLPAMNARTSGCSMPSACERQRRALLGAVVRLVAERERAHVQVVEVERAACVERRAQLRREHVAHPLQPLEHLRAVGAVAQHRARALVERAPGDLAGGLVARHPDRHARVHDARHRPDAAGVVVGGERDLAVLDELRAPRRACRRRPPARAPSRARRASGGTSAAGSIGGPAWVTPPAAWCAETAEAGTTSTTSGRAAASRVTASASVCSAAFMGGDAKSAGRAVQSDRRSQPCLDRWSLGSASRQLDRVLIAAADLDAVARSSRRSTGWLDRRAAATRAGAPPTGSCRSVRPTSSWSPSSTRPRRRRARSGAGWPRAAPERRSAGRSGRPISTRSRSGSV